MSHRALVGLIVALVASCVLSPAAAQSAAVEVSLVSVIPGTPTGDGDWCVGGLGSRPDPVALTAHVVHLASQSEVTEGTLEWQVCESPRGGFPKEVCDTGGGPARWKAAVLSFLDFDSMPTLVTRFKLPVLGFRMQYRPVPGSVFKTATSASFNLDRTCSPLP